jgi:hypothetical protein
MAKVQIDIKRVKKTISKLAKGLNGDLTWGVRFDNPDLPVGHIFPPSRVWADNLVTDDVLPGTSIIRADRLDVLSKTGYFGTPYIVAGWRVNNVCPSDEGEEIVEECEVMAAAE